MRQRTLNGKKTVEAAVEADREINLIIEKVAISQKFDLEAVEAAIRTAVLATGAKVLGGLLEGIGCGRREQSLPCRCGAVMQSKGIEEKTLLTIVDQTTDDQDMSVPIAEKFGIPATRNSI